MKKLLLALMLIPVLLIISGVLILGYYGVVPGLSDLMGTNKPQNLRITYTPQNLTDYRGKSKFRQTETATANPGEGLSYSGQMAVTNTFSASEVSARINYSKWKYMPLTNCQVNFPAEDTVEVSANLRLDRFPGFVEEVEHGKFTKETVEKFMQYFDWAMTNPPIYVRAKVAVTENQAEITVQSFKIGKFEIDADKYNLSEQLEGAVEQIFAQIPGFYAKSVKFSPAGMSFAGTTPETGSVLTE